MQEEHWGPAFLQNLYFPSIGAGYIFLANLLANASLFYWLRSSFASFQWTWDGAEMKKLWVYSFPIMFMSLAAMFNLMFDRLLLEEFLPAGFYAGRTSEDALGIYGNCYKLSVFMSLAIQAFKYAAEPFFLGSKSAENSQSNLALVSHWFVIVCLVLWVGVSSNLFWIQGLFLRQPIYWEGIGVVPILLLANLLLGVYYTQSVWFKKTNKTYMGTVITVTGLAVTLIGNILFIPVYGYMACAYSFLVSAMVMTLLCYVGGQKYDPAPYRWMAAIVYISLGVIAIESGTVLSRLEIPLLISQNIGFICILAYIFIKEFSWKNGRPSLALK